MAAFGLFSAMLEQRLGTGAERDGDPAAGGGDNDFCPFVKIFMCR